MSIRITGTTSTDSKTLVPPLMLGSDSGYNKIGLRRVEFSYTNRIISNITIEVNDMPWYRANMVNRDNYSIAVPQEYYDSSKVVAYLNNALITAKLFLNPLARPATNGIKFSVDTDD